MKTNKQFQTEALNDVLTWLEKTYPNLPSKVKQLTWDDIQWSTTCRFAKFRHKPDKNGRQIRIDIKARKWRTYQMKTIGIYANAIPATEGQEIRLQLVHEITHMIQQCEGRKFSEVETSQNEINFAKEYFPYLYKQLEPIE